MLPDGWEERQSKSTGRTYFYNRCCSFRVFERPEPLARTAVQQNLLLSRGVLNAFVVVVFCGV